MNAARTRRQPAEPILLTEATLEHVLDVFLPEDPNAIAATAPQSDPDPPYDLFASEREAPAAPEAPPIAVAATRLRSAGLAPFETEDASVVQAAAPHLLAESSRSVRTWAIAAGLAIALVSAGTVAIQRLSDRTNVPDVAANRELTPLPSSLASTPPGTPDLAAAPVTSRATSPLAARDVAARDARVAAFPPVTGAVLKGSLSPDPAPRAASESPAPLPLDAVRVSLPIDAPLAPAVVTPALPSPVEPSPEPALAAPAPVAPPPEPVPARDVAPAPRSAPPAAAPVPVVAAPALAVTDTASIESVLGRYRTAFKALDASAARAVWPGVDARALSRAFDQLVEQQLDFQSCDIVVTSGRATAACGGRARYIPKVGTRSMRDEARKWTFSLQKVNDQWLIDKVDSR